VIAATSLDEGDVVRVLRRTVDLLAQIPYVEAVSEQLRSKARQALRAINRFPVCEIEDLLPATGPGQTPSPGAGTANLSPGAAGAATPAPAGAATAETKLSPSPGAADPADPAAADAANLTLAAPPATA
jgi:hypothetical protein